MQHSHQKTNIFELKTKNWKNHVEILSGTKSAKLESTMTIDNPERNQFAVLTSETQIKVIGLPSNTCIYKHMVTEGVIAKASVVVINCKSQAYIDYFATRF